MHGPSVHQVHTVSPFALVPSGGLAPYVNNMAFHVIHAHAAFVYARDAMRGAFKFMKMRPGCKRTPYTSDMRLVETIMPASK